MKNQRAWIVGAVLVVAAIASPLSAQPGCLAEAVALGQSKKGAEAILLGGTIVGSPTVTSPFVRVAIAAADAKRKLLPFDPAAMDELARPVVEVVARPAFSGRMPMSATHVVIRAAGSTDPREAIQPSSLTPFEETASNGFGATATERGVVAQFPLDALRVGREIYIVLGDGLQPAKFKIDEKLLAKLRPSCAAE